MKAGPIRVALRRISATVEGDSSAPRFHLWEWIRSLTGVAPGMRSEVGAALGFLTQPSVTRGLRTAPFNLPSEGRIPSLRFVFSNAWEVLLRASRFFCASVLNFRFRLRFMLAYDPRGGGGPPPRCCERKLFIRRHDNKFTLDAGVV